MYTILLFLLLLLILLSLLLLLLLSLSGADPGFQAREGGRTEKYRAERRENCWCISCEK